MTSENRFEECLVSGADKQSSSEQSCAEVDFFKFDLCVQGAPLNAVLEDQGRVTKVQDLVNTLRTDSLSLPTSSQKRPENMFKVFEGTEAQKQTNTLKFCQFPHTLRKDYSRGAEQGRSQE